MTLEGTASMLVGLRARAGGCSQSVSTWRIEGVGKASALEGSRARAGPSMLRGLDGHRVSTHHPLRDKSDIQVAVCGRASICMMKHLAREYSRIQGTFCLAVLPSFMIIMRPKLGLSPIGLDQCPQKENVKRTWIIDSDFQGFAAQINTGEKPVFENSSRRRGG